MEFQHVRQLGMQLGVVHEPQAVLAPVMNTGITLHRQFCPSSTHGDACALRDF